MQHWHAVAGQLRRLHDHASPEGLPIFGGGNTWQGQIRWLAGWADRSCRQWRLLTSDVLDRLKVMMGEAFASDDEPVSCLLHGGCGPYHWLLRDGTVTAVVDFGDAGRGDPIWDLTVLILWDPQHLPAVLDGYRADTAMRRRVAALHLPCTVLRHLLAINWLVEHGFDPTPPVIRLNQLAS